MTGVDRDDVLARVDLAQLADELLGGRKGSGATARWPSPVPGHPQTGATPPMSIFTTTRGEQRWTCFATGASGTAVDLMMVCRGMDFAEALNALSRRVGGDIGVGRPMPISPPAPAVRPVGNPSPELDTWLAACREELWGPRGRRGLAYLTGRGLHRATLRAHQVGFDPGPRVLPRAERLPQRPRSVVFPVFDADGRPVYAQSRTLDPGRRPKYVNPRSSIAANPGFSFHPARPAQRSPWLVVTEGIPDALTVAAVGQDAVACLGVGLAHGEAVVSGICAVAAGRPVAVCFDPDSAGMAAVGPLVRALAAEGVHGKIVRWTGGDLNDWRRTDPAGFGATFTGSRRRSPPAPHLH